MNMAFNYYPTNYTPYINAYQPYQQNVQQMQPQAQTVQQPQIQNGGFISVRSAQEAFNYPVALGNSVTFKDETAPYIYVKTRGFSQLEEPVFEQFQLVKVENQQKSAEAVPTTNEAEQKFDINNYALKSDLEALQAEINFLKRKVSEMKLDSSESEEMK